MEVQDEERKGKHLTRDPDGILYIQCSSEQWERKGLHPRASGWWCCVLWLKEKGEKAPCTELWWHASIDISYQTNGRGKSGLLGGVIRFCSSSSGKEGKVSCTGSWWHAIKAFLIKAVEDKKSRYGSQWYGVRFCGSKKEKGKHLALGFDGMQHWHFSLSI